MTKKQGDLIGGAFVLMFLIGALAFVGLALAGVVPGATDKTDDSVPTPTPIATPMPTPEPVLLGGEDRRACGYLFTSFEWVVVQRDGRYENKHWFTNDWEVAEDVMTLSDGCYLDEEGRSLFWGDRHEAFDVIQFRLTEFGEGKDDLKLYHQGVQVQP